MLGQRKQKGVLRKSTDKGTSHDRASSQTRGSHYGTIRCWDPNRPDRLYRPIDRPIESGAGAHPIVTQPPVDPRPVAASGQPAASAATATVRAAEEERTPLFAANEAN